MFLSHYLYVVGRGWPPPAHRPVDASGSGAGRSGNREHRLLSRFDGSSRLANGNCRFAKDFKGRERDQTKVIRVRLKHGKRVVEE